LKIQEDSTAVIDFEIDDRPSPLLSKEGRLRLNKKIPFLSSADGVVSKKVA
jgi:hypothetical protein